MIQINLLPHELRPIKRTPVPYILSVLVLLLALAVLGSIWMGNSNTRLERSVELQNHKTQLEELRPITEEMAQLEQQKKILEERIAVIQEIVSDRIIWSRQLWNISRLTPDNVWYSNISQSSRMTTVEKDVPDPKRKGKTIKSKVKVPQGYLILEGYVTGGVDQNLDISPLLDEFKYDEEFSALFQLDNPRLRDTTYEGRPVRAFILEYKISSKTKNTEE